MKKSSLLKMKDLYATEEMLAVAHEDVPDAAAHGIRLVSGSLQCLQHRANLLWDHGFHLFSSVFHRI